MAAKRKCKMTNEYIRKEDGYISANNMFFKNIEAAIEWTQTEEAKKKAKRLKKESEKQERKAIQKRKAELRPKSWYVKEAQKWFNKFIRLRDSSKPCISCGRNHKGQYHAGHFLTTGAHPELRFEELNCHKQCSVCNNHLSGNLINYRINLIKKIGIEKVEWLEGPHEAKHYTIDDLKEIIKTYKAKCKKLEEKAA